MTPTGTAPASPTPHGTTTTYARDAVGRVKSGAQSPAGRGGFTHDAAGRLTAVTAGELVQEWAYRNGFLAEHTRIDRSDPGRRGYHPDRPGRGRPDHWA